MAVRITQNASEVVLGPTSEKARVTQLAAEAAMLPTSEKVRVTQAVAEPVMLPTNEKARITQLVVEVVRTAFTEPCGLPWTFPTPAAYPVPSLGGPLYLYFDEVEPDWGNFGHQFGDGNPKFGTIQSARVRRFVLDYGGLSEADATALDDHYESTKGAISFSFTHPRTAEVLTGVRYENYSRSPHFRVFSQARSARLVRYTF